MDLGSSINLGYFCKPPPPPPLLNFAEFGPTACKVNHSGDLIVGPSVIALHGMIKSAAQMEWNTIYLLWSNACNKSREVDDKVKRDESRSTYRNVCKNDGRNTI